MCIIAGALERKVWIKAFGGRTLYPNIYGLLIGPPGVGKTDAIREVFNFAEELPNLHIAPSNVSRASLIDSLNKAGRSVLRPTEAVPHITFNSLTVASDELGVFLQQYENTFMSTLNKLYDGTVYTEEKRSMKDPIKIDRPLLNIIAGTTPGWLGGNLPETAWVEGFCSRLFMVYSGLRIRVDPFSMIDMDEALRELLVSDLREIHNLYGQFHWEEEVVDAFRTWYNGELQPIPDHPRLEHYLPRRHIHFLKLCMVFSVARSNDLTIRLCDYQQAQDMFLEAEATMPEVFKAMRFNSDFNVIDDAFSFIHTQFAKTGKALPEHRIIHFLAQRMPSHSVQKVLEVMVQSNMLVIANISGTGGRPEYKPTPKADHQN